MDQELNEERHFNEDVNATTSLNTQAEQDVRVLATVYTMYKIGEFYVLFFLTKSHYHTLAYRLLNLVE